MRNRHLLFSVLVLSISLLAPGTLRAQCGNTTATYTGDASIADFTTGIATYATFSNFSGGDVASPFTPTSAELAANGFRVNGGGSLTGLPGTNWILASFPSAVSDILVFPNIDHFGSAYDGYQYSIRGSNDLSTWTPLFDALTVSGAGEPFTLGTCSGTAPSSVNNVLTPGTGPGGTVGYIAHFQFGTAYKYYAFGASTEAVNAGNSDQELSAVAAPAAWLPGDVFVAVGNGKYQVYHNNGTDTSPNYVLVETITVGASGDQTSGCAWDSQLNLYVTNTTAEQVRELNGISHAVVQTLATGLSSTSVLFDSSGNLYVGNANVFEGNAGILKYVPTLPPDTSTGTITYPSSPTGFNFNINSDWIDLVNDQRTLYSTGEDVEVESEDLSAGTPTPVDFGAPLASTAYAIRALSPFDGGTGGFLVADTDQVVKLDGTGTIVVGFSVGFSGGDAHTALRALTLDPNGTSAWVADFSSGRVYRFNIGSGAINVRISTGEGTSPNGLCVKGGPELNVAPLVYSSTGGPNNDGKNVTATAKFGAPGTANFHTWQATFDTVLQNFVLVITATEGIDLARYSVYFPNQAACGGGLDCIGTPAISPTLTPIPYADQVNFAGGNIQGRAVVYRAVNPPILGTQYSGNIFTYGEYTYPPLASAGGSYSPPSCLKVGGTVLPDPRVMRAPHDSQPPNIYFQFDTTTFTGLGDNGWGDKGLNDYNVADRCTSSPGSSMKFLSPLPQATITLGSAIPIKIRALDAHGNPILTLVTPPNDLSLSISQFGLPLEVFGVEGSSPSFFKFANDKNYHGNLDTKSVIGLQLGPATLCVTSIQSNETSTAPAVAPPVCTPIDLVPPPLL